MLNLIFVDFLEIFLVADRQLEVATSKWGRFFAIPLLPTRQPQSSRKYFGSIADSAPFDLYIESLVDSWLTLVNFPADSLLCSLVN